jgi:hypothetical protein
MGSGGVRETSVSLITHTLVSSVHRHRLAPVVLSLDSGHWDCLSSAWVTSTGVSFQLCLGLTDTTIGLGRYPQQQNESTLSKHNGHCRWPLLLAFVGDMFKLGSTLGNRVCQVLGPLSAVIRIATALGRFADFHIPAFSPPEILLSTISPTLH